MDIKLYNEVSTNIYSSVYECTGTLNKTQSALFEQGLYYSGSGFYYSTVKIPPIFYPLAYSGLNSTNLLVLLVELPELTLPQTVFKVSIYQHFYS